MRNKVKRVVKDWVKQIVNPLDVFHGLVGYARYLADWRRYSHLPGAERIELINTYPQVHDRTAASLIDAHYFYVNGWAMRRVIATTPQFHIDIASQTIFANLLAASIPSIFMDYRPLYSRMSNLQSLGGNLLALPFANGSVKSLSCLHVIEHIGLGRYGDPLDPAGTLHALAELTRVLAPGGNLYIATPVGAPRLCFNAHRLYAPENIRDMVAGLELIEFSGIDDSGRYMEHITLKTLAESEYACGLYWFRRPAWHSDKEN
jgi:SAM-dependent methyltransferase